MIFVLIFRDRDSRLYCLDFLLHHVNSHCELITGLLLFTMVLIPHLSKVLRVQLVFLFRETYNLFYLACTKKSVTLNG